MTQVIVALLLAAKPVLCWDPVPAAGDPDESGYLLSKLETIVDGQGRLHVAFEGKDMHTRVWGGSGWQARELTGDWSTPSFALDSKGRAILGVDGSGELANKVAALREAGTRWVPLAPTYVAGPDYFHHANDATLAIGADDAPVIAFHLANQNDPRTLLVARLGAQWELLGPSLEKASDLYGLEPALAVGPDGTLWLAWRGGSEKRSRLRVARWTGSGWKELDTRALQGKGTARKPMLRFAAGTPTLIWTEHAKQAAQLRVARWTGGKWELVPAKVAQPLSDRPAAAVWNDALVVAFSSAATEDDQGAVVVLRLDPAGWTVLFEGLRAFPGQSSPEAVSLAASGDRLFVSWDEDAFKGDRIHTAMLRPCAAGESPRPPVRAPKFSELWPKSVAQAVDLLITELAPESVAKLRGMKREELIEFHLGWGMGLRNRFGMWRGNDALLESCGRVHPDDCSMKIIEAVWERVQQSAADGG